MAIELTHNFDGKRFKWLYAKYANGCNPAHHCTNAIRGKYSKRFSRLSQDFAPGKILVLDEFPQETWDAIYICGVSANGYTKHENYPHNVHVALIPKNGAKDHWEFEDWKMDVENAVFEHVPSEEEIDKSFASLPDEYTTCRMFRWAVAHYPEDVASYAQEVVRNIGYEYCETWCHNLDSSRENYKSNLKEGEVYSENDFEAWVVECLRDGDAIAETVWSELDGTQDAWVIDYLGWPDEEFEEGVEQYVREKFPNVK